MTADRRWEDRSWQRCMCQMRTPPKRPEELPSRQRSRVNLVGGTVRPSELVLDFVCLVREPARRDVVTARVDGEGTVRRMKCSERLARCLWCRANVSESSGAFRQVSSSRIEVGADLVQRPQDLGVAAEEPGHEESRQRHHDTEQRDDHRSQRDATERTSRALRASGHAPGLMRVAHRTSTRRHLRRFRASPRAHQPLP